MSSRFRFVFLAGWAIAAAASCGAETDATSSSVSTSVGTTSVGGAGTGGGGDGATGGVRFPCGEDCNLIDVGPCAESVCNDGSLPGVAGNCVTRTRDDGAPCDDGLFCTVEDECNAGACMGKERDCGYPSSSCLAKRCDEDGDSCVEEAVPDGTSCLHDDLCLGPGTCLMGACQGGTPKDCFPGPVPGPCYYTGCDSTTGLCRPLLRPNGSACQEDCNVGGICTDAVCHSLAPRDCSAFDVGCQRGVCHPTYHVCVAEGPTTSGPCEDGDACTVGEQCQSNQCGGGTSISSCSNGDGCCPAGCTMANDDDCVVTFGWTAPTASTVTTQSIDLLMRKVVVTRAIQLTHLGFLAASGGVQARLALYTDATGNPDALIAETGAFVVAPGAQTVPVTPQLLAPGEYWIGRTTDGPLDVYQGTSWYVKTGSTTFADPFPDPHPVIVTGVTREESLFLQGFAP